MSRRNKSPQRLISQARLAKKRRAEAARSAIIARLRKGMWPTRRQIAAAVPTHNLRELFEAIVTTKREQLAMEIAAVLSKTPI